MSPIIWRGWLRMSGRSGKPSTAPKGGRGKDRPLRIM